MTDGKARALAQQARVILLDEPSSSLDLRHRLSMMETLRSEVANRGVAAVVALHDVWLAGTYCDRLTLLSESRNLAYRRWSAGPALQSPLSSTEKSPPLYCDRDCIY